MGAGVLWSIIAGVTLGILAASYLPLGHAAAALFVLLAAALVFLAAISSSHGRAVSLILAVACVSIAGGIARMHLAAVHTDAFLDAYIRKTVVLEGVVADEPDRREKSVRVHVEVVSATSSERVGVLVVAPLSVNVAYGDRVRAEGTLRFPEVFEATAERSFNYPAYLAKDGILYELAFARVERLPQGNEGHMLMRAAIALKQAYLLGLARTLPEPQSGLAGGITAGDKRGLGERLSDVFRAVGLTHIIVLSGYNIMIVIVFFERILRRAPRTLRFNVAAAVAVSFALMTGLAAASVRAAAMALIAIAGKATRRMYLASRSLGVVALCMVLWNPYVLAFDPGFQLSIIATWGMLALSPLVAARLSLVSERFGLREILATTLGTQLAVLPLLLYQSGTLSLVAIPANVLVLIAVPYAMLASFIAGLLGALVGTLAVPLALPGYMFLSYIVWIAELCARVPFASVSVPMFGAWVLAVMYALLALLAYVKRERPPVSQGSRSG